MSLIVAVVKRVAKATKTSLAVLGFASAVAGGTLIWQTKEVVAEEAKDKKRVLVLPFHSLKFVNSQDRFSWLQSRGNDSVNEIRVQDFVSLIHEAASDPSIVALFGEFGHGRSLSVGAADAEEIRDALRVFRESHRKHNEPNLSYEPLLQRNSNSSPCPLYAYSDTFESNAKPENPDYFIASIFTHIHLQKQGALNLFGHSSSVPFLRKALEKYGAKVHVYKHGPFKNAPNSFTESGFTSPHKKNVETYLFALNNYMFEDIADARRGLHQFTGDMWKLIQNSGTFTSFAAKKMGFVDFTPERSPLEALLASNKQDVKEDEIEALKAKWGSNTDIESFPADEQVSLSDYRNIISKRKRMEAYQWRAFKHLRERAEKDSVVGSVLNAVGCSAPRFNFSQETFDEAKANALSEKIALLEIDGTIDGKTVRKMAPLLKRIKEDSDFKCVVVRVNSPGGTIDASEALLQEFNDLPQKLVFSFGNVSASGGYYIASSADQIFASKRTLTGSIGVYGVRFDFSGVAAQYRVKFGHISTSDFALSNNIFHPCTKQMHANSSRSVDRAYQRFKEVVTSGRSMSAGHLDTIAGGRVWTGQQAKHNGLVDEIGGLQRAVAYARRTYTNGDAQIIVCREEDAYFDRFRKLAANGFALLVNDGNAADTEGVVPTNLTPFFGKIGGTVAFPFKMPTRAFGLYLTADENTAIESFSGNEEA